MMFARRTVLALASALLLAGAAPPRWETLPEAQPLPKPVAAGYLHVNGIDLWRAEYGRGPPVILLHGGLANSEYWGGQVRALAPRYRVITIDSRGHGRSARDERPYSYSLMADDVLAAMDALKIDRAAIVGWSDGGIIGIDIALRHPERLRCLFAFGANTDPSGVRADVDKSPLFNRFIARAGLDYRRLSKTPDGYDAFVAAIGRMWASEPNWTKAQLATIRTPITVADGEHEEAINLDHTRMMAGAIPGARLVILPGVSHFAGVQNPAQFNAAVMRFLHACPK
jgi:pimeloyl-ACP methyl ester carboxylesterase